MHHRVLFDDPRCSNPRPRHRQKANNRSDLRGSMRKKIARLVESIFGKVSSGKTRTGGARRRRKRPRRIPIKKSRETSQRPESLHWVPCHPSTISHFKATMSCSEGHPLTLRGHSIASNGDVMPSVVCRHDGCKFHNYVRLVGWSDGAIE